MTVADAIDKWRDACDRAKHSRSSGAAAGRLLSAVNAAAWDVAHAPCASPADFITKLQWSRTDIADRGVCDAIVLALLDGLADDVAVLG
jgi:hypothetical protein